MPEQTTVPGVGKVKKSYVFGSIGVASGIVIYAYWRARSSAAVAAPTEGDQIAEPYSPDAYTGASGPLGGTTVIPTEGGSSAPLTNPEWVQRVLDMLESAGYDRNFATATIGKWISGNALTAAEKLLIQAAKALLGPPPSGDIPIVTAPETPGTVPPPAGMYPTPARWLLRVPTSRTPRITVGRQSLVPLSWIYAHYTSRGHDIAVTSYWVQKWNPTAQHVAGVRPGSYLWMPRN